MIGRRSSKALSVVCTIVGFALSSSHVAAAPAQYLITQGQWTGGGQLTGSFTGEDLNGDGYIDLAYGEVSDYSVTFSGDSLIPDFSHSFANLLFFRYTVGSPGFRPSFPLYSLGSGFFYDADDYLVGLPDLSRVSFSYQNAQVTPVPEPTSIGLVALALGLLGFSSRPHRAGSSVGRRPSLR